MSTTWEQLEGAALSLARSGAIKDRLTDAYRNHLAFVNADELPDALREKFRACHNALTRERPLPGEDAVRATVRKMSSSEADELAGSVVRLFAAVARESGAEAAAAKPAAPVAEPVRNGTLHSGTAHSGTVLNGLSGSAHPKAGKAVPQVISLYAAEA